MLNAKQTKIKISNIVINEELIQNSRPNNYSFPDCKGVINGIVKIFICVIEYMKNNIFTYKS